MVSFSENHESDLVAFEDGQALASPNNPRNEALKWVYSLGPLPSQHVMIMGLGSGFHVAALAELDPSLKITVVETRESLITVFRSKFSDIADRVQITIVENAQDIFKTETYREAIADKAYILSFRECWGQQTAIFSEIFAHLSGRSVESVKYHFEDLGMNLKALFFNKNDLLSLNDLMPVIEASTAAEKNKQLFRVLGELVK
ncbi:hypothetical protein D3C87_103540 [compost metagenome]